MEFLQLYYFQTVAKMGHLSKAADYLLISQPALSQTINRLETELDVKLFDRKGRNIMLNESGKILLKYADNIFNSLEDAKKELDDYKKACDKSVSLCIGATSMLLPDLLKYIKERVPDLQITTYMKDSECDLNIYASHTLEAGANKILLLEEEILLALPKGHPLTFKENLTHADLASLSFISLDKSSGLYQTLEYYLNQTDIKIHNDIYIDNPSIMRSLLLNGNYAAFIPATTWYDFSDGTLEYYHIQDLEMKRYIYIKWKDSRYISEYVKECIKYISEFYKTGM